MGIGEVENKDWGVFEATGKRVRGRTGLQRIDAYALHKKTHFELAKILWTYGKVKRVLVAKDSNGALANILWA